MANFATYITLKDGTNVYFSDAALQDSIANTEMVIAATAAHEVGDYILIEGGSVYKVIAPIAIGDTLVVGTNIEATTIGDELKAVFKALENVSTVTYDAETSSLVFGS